MAGRMGVASAISRFASYWVGFTALSGIAVQTGVVMVIYLEEAVTRKRAAIGELTVDLTGLS